MKWDEVRVEELAASGANALSTGPFGSSIGARFFTTHGVPLIRGSNLSQDLGTRLVDEDWVFVSQDKASEFARSIVHRGDLIFTCWGTIDQVGIIDGRARFSEYIVSNKQMKLTPDPAKADSLFLYYLFKSPDVREQILGRGIGSSVPGFNLGALRSMRIRVPPLAYQRAISGLLGALDGKIDLNRRMNRTLEELALALFKSWFVDFDPVQAKRDGRKPVGVPEGALPLFPGHFEDSDLGPIPKGWSIASLKDICDLNPRRELRRDAEAPYVEMSSIPTSGHTPERWPLRKVGSGMRFMNGDTLLARITPCLENGKTAYADFLSPDQVAWGSTEYIVMRSKAPAPLPLSYLLARHEPFRDHAIQSMTGSSGRQRVALDALERFQLAVPRDAGVLVAFGHVVDPLFHAAKANAADSRTLGTLRDALLPGLLSGEVTIKQAEKAVAEVA